MKIKIIIENTVFQAEAKAELGFSAYIKTDDNHKILFDTGQTGLFAENAKLFDIDIAQIDSLVISHGHYDHSGGLQKFLSLNNHANIYVKEGYDSNKFNRYNKYIGFPKEICIPKDRLIIVKESTEIAKGVYISPDVRIYDAEETHFTHLTIQNGEDVMVDTFEEEQYLTLINNNKMSIISGCAHRGIVNTIMSAINTYKLPIDLILGGFHTLHESDTTIEKLAEKLNALKIERIVACHCTGIEQYALLKNKYHGEISYGHVGLNLEV